MILTWCVKNDSCFISSFAATGVDSVDCYLCGHCFTFSFAATGVESVDCYCVDNLLARVSDPMFVGYCHSQGEQGKGLCVFVVYCLTECGQPVGPRG